MRGHNAKSPNFSFFRLTCYSSDFPNNNEQFISNCSLVYPDLRFGGFTWWCDGIRQSKKPSVAACRCRKWNSLNCCLVRVSSDTSGRTGTGDVDCVHSLCRLCDSLFSHPCLHACWVDDGFFSRRHGCIFTRFAWNWQLASIDNYLKYEV